MKKISYWATSNPVKARWLIVLATILLLILGVEVGFGFAAWDIEIPFFVTAILASSLLLMTTLFHKKTSSILTRRFHFAVCIGTYLCAICFGNLFMFEVEKMSEPISQVKTHTVFHQVSQKSPALERNPETISTIGLLKMRSVKKYTKALKGKVKEIKKRYRNLPRGAAFALFISSSILAFLLTYLSVALVVLFAFAEAGALVALFAIIALLFFLGGLFFLGYAFYRLFERQDRKNPAPGPAPTPTPPYDSKNSKG